MVCIRDLSCLLLAFAAAPAVLATPLVDAGVALVRRQDSASDGASAASPTSGASTPSASPSQTSSSSSASASATPTSSSSPSPTSNTPTSNTPSATQGPTSTNSPSPTSSSNNSPTTPPSQTTTKPRTSNSVATVTASNGQITTAVVILVVTSTASDGQAVFNAATTVPSVAPSDTANAVPENTSPASNNKSPSTGTIVGGVVGGVGGAILIAALAAVAWRVWGKNRHRRDEDDSLMDGTYGTSEVKTGGGPANNASPFTNNLEQYHAAGPAQNF